MPWSTAFRIATNRGSCWSKATGPGPAHEGPLLAILAADAIPHVLYPLAADPARAWLLFEDGGPTLRSLRPDMSGDRDLAAWERILREYAVVQRRVEALTSDLLGAGVPDERPERLPAILERLLDDERLWAQARPEHRSARGRLRASMPTVRAAAGTLASAGIRPSVDHGDLHSRNVLVGEGGDRIFDWGDASIAHPFVSMTSTMGSIAYHTGLAIDGPELARLRDAYTEAWSDIAPPDALAELADLAIDLGLVGRATSWERALLDLEPDAMGGFEGAAAERLSDLADQMDRRSTAT
jgi:hypothetical protein